MIRNFAYGFAVSFAIIALASTFFILPAALAALNSDTCEPTLAVLNSDACVPDPTAFECEIRKAWKHLKMFFCKHPFSSEATVGLLAANIAFAGLSATLFSQLHFFDNLDVAQKKDSNEIIKRIFLQKNSYQVSATKAFSTKPIRYPLARLYALKGNGFFSKLRSVFKVHTLQFGEHEGSEKFSKYFSTPLPVFILDLPEIRQGPDASSIQLADYERQIHLKNSDQISTPSESMSSKIMHKVVTEYGYAQDDFPTFILQDVTRGGVLSDGGQLSFRTGRYREFFEFCEVPLWQSAERIGKKFTDGSIQRFLCWIPFFKSWDRSAVLSGKRWMLEHLKQKINSDLNSDDSNFNPYFREQRSEANDGLNVPNGWVEYKLSFFERHASIANMVNTDVGNQPPPLGMGIMTILVLQLSDRSDFILFRRSKKGDVAEAAGQSSVVPAGTFQPSFAFDTYGEQTITETVVRELAEEIYGIDMADGRETNLFNLPMRSKKVPNLLPLEKSKEAEGFMDAALDLIDRGDVKLLYLGLGADILTAKLQMFTALVLPEKVLRENGPLSLKNWCSTNEGVLESWPFQKAQLRRFLKNWETENLSSAGAGCMYGAYKLFDVISAELESGAGVNGNRSEYYDELTMCDVGIDQNPSTEQISSAQLHEMLRAMNNST